MKNKTNIVDAALRISAKACETAKKDFALQAGFYGMKQEYVEGQQCLVLSIIIAEPLPEKPLPKKVQFVEHGSTPLDPITGVDDMHPGGIVPGWESTVYKGKFH